LAARNRRTSSLKHFAHKLFGGAAIGCLVVGCGVLVYTKIIAASAFPTLGAGGYDEPVVKSAPRVAAPQMAFATRNASDAVNEAFAALPDTSVAKMVAAPVITSSMFNERFAAAVPQSVASNAANGTPPLQKFAEAKPVELPKLTEVLKSNDAPKTDAPRIEALKKDTKPVAPMQIALASLKPQPPAEAPPAKSGIGSLRDMTQRAKAAVLSITGERRSIQDKLWGKPEQPQNGGLLAYASADANFTASVPQDPTKGGQAPYDRSTAVYDISAKTVYLPDGSKLEAHSGLGDNLDNPRSETVRMRGVTPPHIYELKPREALFHGVPALRLNPVGGSEAIHGRDGLLAHTFMLGPGGDSNGCVSFRDYYAFLDAYKNKGIRRLAVVARVD
jgi:Protein of unknown function (DUF2778)